MPGDVDPPLELDPDVPMLDPPPLDPLPPDPPRGVALPPVEPPPEVGLRSSWAIAGVAKVSATSAHSEAFNGACMENLEP